MKVSKFLIPFQMIIVALGVLQVTAVQAQEEAYILGESISGVVDQLDSESRNLIAEEMEQCGVQPEQLRVTQYLVTQSGNAVALLAPSVSQVADQPMPYRQGQFLLMLGAGAGLIHNLGISTLVVRRNSEGRLTWFVQGDVDYLRARFGYAPDRLSAGVGVFPFRSPVVSIALKADQASYTSKIGFGPELSVNKFFGQNQRVMVSGKLDAPVYLGEKNNKGQNFSVLPELKIGVAFKLFGRNRR